MGWRFYNSEGEEKQVGGLTPHAHPEYQLEAEKGAASGYAPLDDSELVPLANIPATLVGKDADTVDGKEGADLADKPHGTAQHAGPVIPADSEEDIGRGFVDFEERASPANPAAGKRRVYADSGLHTLAVRTAAGVVKDLEGGGGGGGSLDYFDVSAYGAVGDGVTDDTASVNAALAALRVAGRGVLYFPRQNASIYLVSGTIYVQTVAAKPDIIVRCSPGVVIRPNADITVFSAKQTSGDQFGDPGIGRYCIFDTVTVRPETDYQATAFKVEDTYGVVFRDCKALKCAVGVHLRTYDSWTEGWLLEDVLLDDCTTGWKFEKAAGSTGTGSFQDGVARHVHIRDGLRCIDIGTGAVVSNCVIDGLQFWVATTNLATGLYCDGNLDQTVIAGLFEAQGAPAGANRYAFWWGPNAVYLTTAVISVSWFSTAQWAGGNEFAGAVNNPSGINWVYSPPNGRPVFAPSATMILDTSTDTPADFTKSSPYTGTINVKTDATHITYNDPSAQEGSLTHNLVLRNTTRGTKARIVSVNKTTNAIVLEANSPQDAAAWQNGDAITTASAVNTGRTGTFVDVDVTDWATRQGVGMIIQLSAFRVSGTAQTFAILHPWEAYAEGKEFAALEVQGFWQYLTGFCPLRWEGGRAYITLFIAVGASVALRVNSRYFGQV